MESSHSKKKGLFEVLEAKQAFWLGFITAVLAIGTLGFVILGSCVLKGECAVEGVALADAEDTVEADEADDVAPVADAQPTGAVPVVSEDDHIRGDINAPITIIEYSDFECPYCTNFHQNTMLKVMEEYDGQVRWVYRHFPLSFHPEAGPAAMASECAADQDMFWEYADELVENSDNLGDDVYTEIATTVGLDVATWQDCYDNETYADKVGEQATAGAKAGVSGTPGSFIIDQEGNAVPIKGALPFESVAAAIDEML